MKKNGEPFRIGTLTPSSNTTLEPMSMYLAETMQDVTLHFNRFRVLSISMKAKATSQFETDVLLDAARLLADARLDAIIWSGTSSGWLGMAADYELCKAIEDDTGIPTTTSVLALFEAFDATSAKKVGLVSPYLPEIQERIMATFGSEGYEVVSERHKSYEDNFSFSTITEKEIEEMIRDVAKAGPDVITVFCTNLRGMAVVTRMEEETGIPIYDSVATPIWKVLRDAGLRERMPQNRGRLFHL
jgi:maleate isomerase